jgi:hypothetical protein
LAIALVAWVLAVETLRQSRSAISSGTAPGGVLADQPQGDFRRQQRLAARRNADRPDQLGRVGVLDQEPGCPRAYPPENVLVQVEGGQDDDMGAAEAEQEMLTAVEAAEAAHRGREELLTCGTCGRRMESAWSNGKPAYRCRHGHTSATPPDPGRARNVYVRETPWESRTLPMLIHGAV